MRAVVRRRAPWLTDAEQTLTRDLTDDDRIGEVVGGASAVVHLAAPNEVIAAQDPDAAMSQTVAATRRLIDAAAAGGVRRFVYLSTVHVYGAALQPGTRITEDVVPAPRAAYSIARLASEHVCHAFAGDVDVVVFRLTNSVGAPAHPSVDRWTLVANDLCRQAALTGRMRLLTDGSQWRDFVDLGEVCGVIADAATGNVEAGTYNLGAGVPVSIRQLAALVQDTAEAITGTRPELDAPPAPASGPEPYVVDVDKLAAAARRPSADIGEAIAETLRFCIEWKDELR